MSKLEVTAVIKLGLEPGVAEAQVLDGQSRICNWLYNTLLDTAQNLRKKYIETKDSSLALTVYSKRGLRNLLPKLKEEHPFLKVVHSSPLKNAALRLSDSIQTHQKSKKGKRKGKITGWPKFRSWKASWFSLFYDEPGKGYKVEDNQLILSLGMEPMICKAEIRDTNRGVGSYVAEQVFNQFPGVWETSQIPENTAAIEFWDRIVSRYSHGQFEKILKTVSEPKPHPMIILKFTSQGSPNIQGKEK